MISLEWTGGNQMLTAFR